jgi:hypothetical protein
MQEPLVVSLNIHVAKGQAVPPLRLEQSKKYLSFQAKTKEKNAKKQRTLGGDIDCGFAQKGRKRQQRTLCTS